MNQDQNKSIQELLDWIDERFFGQAGNRLLVNGQSSPQSEDYTILEAQGGSVFITATALRGDNLSNYELEKGSRIGGPYTNVQVVAGTGTLIAYIKPEKYKF